MVNTTSHFPDYNFGDSSIDQIPISAMDLDDTVEYVNKMIILHDFERVDPQAPTVESICHIGELTYIISHTTDTETYFRRTGQTVLYFVMTPIHSPSQSTAWPFSTRHAILNYTYLLFKFPNRPRHNISYISKGIAFTKNDHCFRIAGKLHQL